METLCCPVLTPCSQVDSVGVQPHHHHHHHHHCLQVVHTALTMCIPHAPSLPPLQAMQLPQEHTYVPYTSTLTFLKHSTCNDVDKVHLIGLCNILLLSLLITDLSSNTCAEVNALSSLSLHSSIPSLPSGLNAVHSVAVVDLSPPCKFWALMLRSWSQIWPLESHFRPSQFTYAHHSA